MTEAIGMDEVIRINRKKDAARAQAEEGLRILKMRPSLKSFMGSKKAYRKLKMELKKKAEGGDDGRTGKVEMVSDGEVFIGKCQ
jgi:hypothetical protein